MEKSMAKFQEILVKAAMAFTLDDEDASLWRP
jgi:hypothetical protein